MSERDQKTAPTAPTGTMPGVPKTVKAEEVGGEPTVTMIFPHAVLLAVDHVHRIQFREGAQQVPVSLKDHWYLKAHGVTLYVVGSATPAQQVQAESEARVRAEEKAAAKKKADDDAAEAVRVADQKAEDEKRQAESQQVADAAESARTGKPVDQIRRDRQTKAAKAAK